MQWYLIVVLTWVSLMANDVEIVFSLILVFIDHLYWYVIFGDISIKILAHYFLRLKMDYVSFHYCVSVLYSKHLIRYDLQVFADFFTFLMVSCEPQKLLIFSWSLVCTLFPLLANDFGFLNCCLIQGHKDWCWCFLLRVL